MLRKLENYYKENGILSTSFTCEYKGDCKGDCKTFTGPKSAFVSSGYEKGKLPRLLFLSLDSGKGSKDSKERLPSAIRKKEESDRDVLKLHKSKHWYRTHELAWYILKEFKPEIKVEDTKRFFAHANSAKCCMNKPQKKLAAKRLFKNCRRYLKEELDILSPQILVTQGNEAKEAILPLVGTTGKTIDEFASIVVLSDRTTFWLHTYHPSNYGSFNKQRNGGCGWEVYSKKIHEFITVQN
ncbi:uracil-DNA glycosylase family protein [Candidatus Mycalebacterium sp.]